MAKQFLAANHLPCTLPDITTLEASIWLNSWQFFILYHFTVLRKLFCNTGRKYLCPVSSITRSNLISMTLEYNKTQLTTPKVLRSKEIISIQMGDWDNVIIVCGQTHLRMSEYLWDSFDFMNHLRRGFFSTKLKFEPRFSFILG